MYSMAHVVTLEGCDKSGGKNGFGSSGWGELPRLWYYIEYLDQVDIKVCVTESFSLGV